MAYLFIILSLIPSLTFGIPSHLRQPNVIEGPGKPLFLTPYIESGRIKEGQQAAQVSGILDDVKSYSGYLTVNKEYKSNTFFWFFESEINPETSPILVWLQGGPGASSLYGLFTENGPVKIVGDKFVKREHRWNKRINLIYFDNPVGTGYSFTRFNNGYATNQTQIGIELYSATVQFLKLFPHLQKNKFYISGESYAGKYIPAFGYTIHEKNSDPKTDFKINLHGLLIGDGWTDPVNMLLYSDYLYQHGFLDNNERQQVSKIEETTREQIYKKDWNAAHNLTNKIWTYLKTFTSVNLIYNYIDVNTELWPASGDSVVTSTEFRRSVHVGDEKWHNVINNTVYTYLYQDFNKSVIDWVIELLNHYEVIFYNGQLDVCCAYPLTENVLSKMVWDGKEEFSKTRKYPWRVDGEVAGYYRKAKNLTFVLVRNAGHMVPADQPKWAEEMVNRLVFDGRL